MRWLLLALSGLSFAVGCLFFSVASSAVQEIEALILFVCCAVLLAGAATTEAIERMTQHLTKPPPKAKYPRATPL